MKNLQDEMEYNKLLMPITSGDIYSFTYTIYTQLFINLLDLANSEKEQLLGHHQPKTELLKHLNELLLNSNNEEARNLTKLFFVKLLDNKELISIVDKNELHKRINTSINEKENKENNVSSTTCESSNNNKSSSKRTSFFPMLRRCDEKQEQKIEISSPFNFRT